MYYKYERQTIIQIIEEKIEKKKEGLRSNNLLYDRSCLRIKTCSILLNNTSNSLQPHTNNTTNQNFRYINTYISLNILNYNNINDKNYKIRIIQISKLLMKKSYIILINLKLIYFYYLHDIRIEYSQCLNIERQ